MKSHSDSLFHLALSILTDVAVAYPAMRGVDLDIKRLSLLVENRGLGVFTLDLPALGSNLTEAFETGRLTVKGTSLYSKRYPVPRLFSGLYKRIFSQDLRLRVDADVNAILFLRQLLDLGKKTEIPCSKKRELNAIKEFFDVERKLVHPTLAWGMDVLDTRFGGNLHLNDVPYRDLPLFPDFNAGKTRRIQLFINRCQQVADTVATELGIYCPDCHGSGREARGRGYGLRHGPGAVSVKHDRYDKYQFKYWPSKLEQLYPFSLLGRMPNDEQRNVVNHEVPSKLISVPKTAKGPRLIASEPVEHMFCQQMMSSWLEERISETCLSQFIDLRDQSKSAKLVVKASLDRELATIDLSSASDRLTLWLTERIFRKNPSILKALHSSRTRWTYSPELKEYTELKKLATQGTAITFPIQSIIFCIIAIASSITDGVVATDTRTWKKLRNKVRVYGDDIILPSTGYVGAVELFSALHLQVNATKSFSSGYFRESCGMDAFKGYDVTPIKPKTTVPDSPASCAAILDITNNLFYKGYWNATKYLQKRHRPDSFARIGVMGRDAGARAFGSFSFSTVFRRFARDFREAETGGNMRASFRERTQLGELSFGQFTVRRDPSVVAPFMGVEALQFLSASGHRSLRYNRSLHRWEARLTSIEAKSKIRPFDSGYSGLLDGQLCPSYPGSYVRAGIRGVPERPSYRKVARWVDLFALCEES